VYVGLRCALTHTYICMWVLHLGICVCKYIFVCVQMYIYTHTSASMCVHMQIYPNFDLGGLNRDRELNKYVWLPYETTLYHTATHCNTLQYTATHRFHEKWQTLGKGRDRDVYRGQDRDRISIFMFTHINISKCRPWQVWRGKGIWRRIWIEISVCANIYACIYIYIHLHTYINVHQYKSNADLGGLGR